MMYLWEAASEVTQAEAGLAEKMGNAALNTLMGMGIVFLVLILISLIISAFGIIHKLEEKKNGRKRKVVPEADARVRGIGEETAGLLETASAPAEELADDRELVAVIAAAIAAFEGTDPSGFTVRSIRRIQNNGRRR